MRARFAAAFGNKQAQPCKPFGGPPNQSIGPWPEFIYRGFKCPRSEKGLCSPCGYSNIPAIPADRKAVNKSLILQTEYVLSSFDEVVLKNQRRKKPYPAFRRRHPDGDDVMFVLTPTGSFFCDAELDHSVRIQILQMIASGIASKRVNAQIFVESHVLDIIDFHEDGKFPSIMPMLKELNTVLILGLETTDDFNRNILYCKQFDMEDFEKAVDIVKNKLGLETGAFVFAGHHSMSEYETLVDVRRSFSYLRDLGVMPVLMISNLQPYTMNHLLYHYGEYRLPDPRTILSLVRTLADVSPALTGTERWLFADPRSGPPDPALHPFNNPRAITCGECASTILAAICGDYELSNPNGLRETYDWDEFEKKIIPTNECRCRLLHENHLKELARREASIVERAKVNLDLAIKRAEAYCDKQEKSFRITDSIA